MYCDGMAGKIVQGTQRAGTPNFLRCSTLPALLALATVSSIIILPSAAAARLPVAGGGRRPPPAACAPLPAGAHAGSVFRSDTGSWRFAEGMHEGVEPLLFYSPTIPLTGIVQPPCFARATDGTTLTGLSDGTLLPPPQTSRRRRARRLPRRRPHAQLLRQAARRHIWHSRRHGPNVCGWLPGGLPYSGAHHGPPPQPPRLFYGHAERQPGQAHGMVQRTARARSGRAAGRRGLRARRIGLWRAPVFGADLRPAAVRFVQ
jgi:hypothetical protein